MGKDKKKRIDVVYSTNRDFEYEYEEDETQKTLPPEEQLLYVSVDKKRRAGKEVTLVEGFVGMHDDLKDLAKLLKSNCGVGGSAKDGEIIVQGAFKQKIVDILISGGYNVKTKGG